MTFLAPLQAAADDTEVFFGRVDQSQQIRPNVLFALDTSGSMGGGANDPGASESRLTRMKSALVDILEGASNINIGLMRFNGFFGGGPILYPVSDIDEEVCLGGDCSNIPENNRIGTAANNAEEDLATDDVFLNGYTLSMGSPVHNNNLQRVGLRFESINIPSGSTITSARLEFVADASSDDTANLIIGLDDVNDSPVITANDRNLSNRNMAPGTVNWSPGPWVEDSVYHSPDLTAIIQDKISDNGWCGGNALTILIDGTGRRDAKSTRTDVNSAPALNITYDSANIPPGMGCSHKKIVSQIRQNNDDAEEYLINNQIALNSPDLELPRDGNFAQMVGLRFQNLGIPQGATITKASIEFEIDEGWGGNTSLNIWGEANDSAEVFKAETRNITNRAKTGQRVDWINPPALPRNNKLTTPELKTIVQEVVNRTGWQLGNSMAFLINAASNSNRRTVEAFEGEPSNAAQLTVEYISHGAPRFTVRDVLIEEVDNLRVQGGTPILDVMYEATKYMRGEEVFYGKTRGNNTVQGDQRHPFHRISHPDSYNGGTISRPTECTTSDYENNNCIYETILAEPDTPTYISPMDSSCQTNHLIVLSDGEPTYQSSQSRVKSLIGKATCADTGDRACITDLATWMATNDHSTGIDGNQNITTYTIGFGADEGLDFLEEVSKAGAGQHFEAVSSEELQQAFSSILSDVLDTEATFVAPGATVNQFNRLTHRNDIYFSLFRPLETPLWDGNLKKYRLFTNDDGSVDIVDALDKPAVDEASGFFSSGAKSIWSDVIDGNDVALGGAAAQIEIDNATTNPRRIFTYSGSAAPQNVDLTQAQHALHEDNTNLTAAILGIDASDTQYRTDLLRWSRGLDILDVDNDSVTNEARQHMGDPMHSRPLIVNYASSGDKIDSTIYVATNEGFIHAIDHEDGSEHFAFIPQELLPNLDDFYVNASTTVHPYGLDGQQSFWHNDKNGNATVDPDEEAILFVGMRRGGNNYYALDISDRSAPRLMWVIKGGLNGTPGFEELAQTWSAANVSSIKIGSDEKRPVLIFGAGYDTNQDDDPALDTRPRRADISGRGIFVVDVETGERLWSVSPEPGLSNHTQLSDMLYSIPSDIRVIDANLDGNADQMYVGDMGGQVWRFDFNTSNPGGQLIDGGIIADFSSTDAEDARRFYYEPDVSLLDREGERFMSLSIGSGWRAHPLDEVIDDKFFTIRMPITLGKPDGYGKLDPSGTTNSYSPYTENDLLDVTNIPQPLESDVLAHSGWVLDLPTTGEKVLGGALTVNNQVIFTTYQPDLDIGICDTAAGGGSVYVLDTFDGSPVIDFNQDSEDNDSDFFDEEDRSKPLQHGGIPPEPSALITEEGVPVLAAGPQLIDEVDFGGLTERSWWREATSEDE